MSETYADDEPEDPKPDAKPKGKKAKKIADEAEFVADARKKFDLHEQGWDENRKDALDDIRFARLAEQWPEQIRRDRELDGRPCLTLNQLPSFIRQVVNDGRQNKPGIQVHPVGDGADVETAQVFEGLIRHIEQSSDGDVAYDTALDFAVTGGFGFFRIGMRYANDTGFEKELTVERIANPLSVYPPRSDAADSSDWNDLFILDEISKDAWEARWPDKECVAFDGPPSTQEHRTEEDMLRYAEYWCREEVPKTIVALTGIGADQALAMPAASTQATEIMGAEMVVDEEVYLDHKELFDALGVKVQGKRDVISHKVTQYLLSGSEVLEEVEWAGEYIPVVPVWGEELNVEGERKLRSLVRDAKDPQRMFNFWRTCATELVALAPKTPFIGRKGAFETDASKWATANTQNHAYIEFDGLEAPERSPFAGVPAGVVQEANSAQQDMHSIMGIFNSSLGAASNETSGIAINARDKQADTGTFHFIDNLNRAIRHAGRILLDLIPRVYSTPRILRILDPDGSARSVPVNQPVVMGPNGQPVPAPDPTMLEGQSVSRIFDLTAGNYDLVVKSGPSFSTRREELTSSLTEMIRAYPPSAAALFPLIVKNMDIPDAEEAVQRLEALGPNNPQLQEAHKALQALQKEVQALTLKNQELQGKRDGYIRDNQIDAFNAETKRIAAIAPDGLPVDPGAISQTVMLSMLHILSSPDLIPGMQNGADPQALMQALAQRMQGGGAPGQGGPPPPAASPMPVPAGPTPVMPPMGQAA